MRQIKFLRFVLLIALLVIAINPVQAQEEGKVVVPAGEKIKIAVITDLTNLDPRIRVGHLAGRPGGGDVPQ